MGIKVRRDIIADIIIDDEINHKYIIWDYHNNDDSVINADDIKVYADAMSNILRNLRYRKIKK